MKLSLAVFLLINGISACDYDLDQKQWQFLFGSTANDVQVARSDGKMRIQNKNGTKTLIYLPLKTATNEPKCDFPQIYMRGLNSQVGFENFKTSDVSSPSSNIAQTIFVPYQDIIVTHSENQSTSNSQSGAVETGDDYFNDISMKLNIDSGTARIDQDGQTLADFQSDEFEKGFSFLVIYFEDEGEYVEIKVPSKEEILQKENAALKKKVTTMTTSLDQCKNNEDDMKKEIAQVKQILSKKRTSTDAALNMVESDFSDQNDALKNDIPVNNSTFITRDIVDYILIGLVAVLTSVVAYQYKGIQTLKRVANGSDYQKM